MRLRSPPGHHRAAVGHIDSLSRATRAIAWSFAQRIRKPLYPQGYRGFESLPLRQLVARFCRESASAQIVQTYPRLVPGVVPGIGRGERYGWPFPTMSAPLSPASARAVRFGVTISCQVKGVLRSTEAIGHARRGRTRTTGAARSSRRVWDRAADRRSFAPGAGVQEYRQ
jgi:hypothetical protein